MKEDGWNRDKIRDCVGKFLINAQIPVCGEGDPNFGHDSLFWTENGKRFWGGGEAPQPHCRTAVPHRTAPHEAI